MNLDIDVIYFFSLNSGIACGRIIEQTDEYYKVKDVLFKNNKENFTSRFFEMIIFKSHVTAVSCSLPYNFPSKVNDI